MFDPEFSSGELYSIWEDQRKESIQESSSLESFASFSFQEENDGQASAAAEEYPPDTEKKNSNPIETKKK